MNMRKYLSIMENNSDIEKISKGIYLLPNAFEDSYFSFQQRYKKAVFFTYECFVFLWYG